MDGYGIGTQLVTGSPVNGVYKLVEIDGIPVMKEAVNKISYPGRKQVFRRINDGKLSDRIGLMDDEIQAGEVALLEKVMENGQRLNAVESLETIARRTRSSVIALPNAMRSVRNPAIVVAEISPSLDALVEETRRSP